MYYSESLSSREAALELDTLSPSELRTVVQEWLSTKLSAHQFIDTALELSDIARAQANAAQDLDDFKAVYDYGRVYWDVTDEIRTFVGNKPLDPAFTSVQPKRFIV